MVKYSSPPLPDLFYHMQNTKSAHRRKILNISLICTQSFVHIKLETWKACKNSALCVVVSISISRGIPRPWASFIILLELRSLEEERVPMYVTPVKNMPKHFIHWLEPTTGIIYFVMNCSDYVNCPDTFKEKVYKIPKWFLMIANSLTFFFFFSYSAFPLGKDK